MSPTPAPIPTPTADATKTTEAAPEATADAVTETAPAKVKVKSISKNPMYLSCGELLFEKEAEITYAEFCNLAGTYVEKV
jgi:hypothetical protein